MLSKILCSQTVEWVLCSQVLLQLDDACFGGSSKGATMLLEAFVGYDTVRTRFFAIEFLNKSAVHIRAH